MEDEIYNVKQFKTSRSNNSVCVKMTFQASWAGVAHLPGIVRRAHQAQSFVPHSPPGPGSAGPWPLTSLPGWNE